MDRWNDERLDELSRRVDDGFKEVNARFDQMATRTELQGTRRELEGTRDDLRFLSSRFDKLQNTLLIVGGGLMGTVIASTAALITALS